MKWDRYLQFTSSEPNWSQIQSEHFFLSPEGRYNSEAEWRESIKAYQLERSIFTSGQSMSFDCAFPARMRMLVNFGFAAKVPEPCEPLKKWRAAFSGKTVYIDYVGSYINNPASIFGHTFLRFSRIGELDDPDQLRSQTLSYLANVSPQDGEMITILKGLFGKYEGQYNIQPYYMNAAMYNNAEARNLWEFRLKLTSEEVEFLIDYLWELSHFASSQYWFLNKNCSHQLLVVLEAVRPISFLTKQERSIVLPLDTIRILKSSDMISEDAPIFEPSIQKRIDARFEKMNEIQRAKFIDWKSGKVSAREVDDRLVLDTIIETLTQKNYKANARLPKNEAEEFADVLTKRAQLGGSLQSIDVYRPVTPLARHKTSLVQLGGGRDSAYARGLLGAHSLDSHQLGMEDSSTIEYAGAELFLGTQAKKTSDLKILIGKVRALNAWTIESRNWSWYADGFLNFHNSDFQNSWSAHTAGGGGVTFRSKEGRLLLALMALAEIRVWDLNSKSHWLGTGPSVVAKLNLNQWQLFSELKNIDYSDCVQFEWRSGLEYFPKSDPNTSLGIQKITWREQAGQSLDLELFTFRRHF